MLFRCFRLGLFKQVYLILKIVPRVKNKQSVWIVQYWFVRKTWSLSAAVKSSMCIAVLNSFWSFIRAWRFRSTVKSLIPTFKELGDGGYSKNEKTTKFKYTVCTFSLCSRSNASSTFSSLAGSKTCAEEWALDGLTCSGPKAIGGDK